MKSRRIAWALLGSSLLATTPCFAETAPVVAGQDEAAEAQAGEGAEIVVTARRKDESLQEVPLTVNAVTADDLAKLNIRRFEDISAIVPGLSLGGANNATIRGVSFNIFASGFNGTIEFYLNDSPAQSDVVFGQQYDLGQIEVLRGPQGTLRGRASPSGSITVTTRRPDLQEIGGYASMTATQLGGINMNAALSVPIIADMLSIRVAGLVDENKGSTVQGFAGNVEPFSKTLSGRVTARFVPTDTLDFTLTYQRTELRNRAYDQVESMQVLDPAAPASPVLIRATDRLAVQDHPNNSFSNRDAVNLQARWSFAGQRLNYVGSKNTTHGHTDPQADTGNFFGPSAPAVFNMPWGQSQDADSGNTAHELRLSSEEPLFGMVDYTVGGFVNTTTSVQAFGSVTPIFIPSTNTGLIVTTPILREARNKEKSVFGNLTVHIGDATELSGGLRRIDYRAVGSVKQGAALTPVPAAAQNDHFKATIYTASIKHEFSDDLMVYALTGSSWRPGVTVIGNFSIAPSPLEQTFMFLPPEKSKSYELGLKSSFLDKKLRLNLAAFHQRFDNYPFRSSTGQYYVTTNAVGTPPVAIQSVAQFNFVGAVPVKVTGVEGELAYASRSFDIGASAAYAKGKISNGLVPCNDYFPRDGIPDTVSTVPTVGQILATGSTISGCTVNYRSSQSPLFNASIQAEYRLPLFAGGDAFLRGQASYNGKSLNDPLNTADNVSAYALLNLFAGIRSPDGAWELSIYGRNITDTERVLTRGQTPLNLAYRLNGVTAAQGVTTYRGITMTAPRELGINLRYAFGSR